jgi:hypothetical protein
MPVRPLYSATILLGGSRDNSVFVSNMTAVELFVLKAIHGVNESGTDPITNVSETGKGVERSDTQERARIATRYNAPGAGGGLAILNALYGVGNPLPLKYVPPDYVEPTDAPLLREEETLVDISNDPISSVPPPKKPVRASVLEQ